MLRLLRTRVRCGLLGCAAALMLTASHARAHGEPPTAHAVIRADAEGPLLVKLGVGFALRVAAERFRYLCPALWAGELTAPAAALSDGRVVLGASAGLMLLDADGSLRPHPDPVAAGFSTEIVASAGGVFALRFKDGKSEVVAVDGSQARVIWSDARVWYSLAPLAHGLVLLRANNMLLEQVTLSFDGALLDSQQAVSLRNVDYVFARGLEDDAYALLLSQSASELGRIQGNAFGRAVQAAGSIAGPIALPEGTLLASDGQLQTLDLEGQLRPLAEASYVGCLEQHEHGAYACTREGVSRVSHAGLGEAVFALTWLLPPDLEQLRDEKARARCDYQWQDLRFDLLALGMPLRFEDEFGADAGAQSEDAGVDADAAEPSTEQPEAGEEPPASAKESSRCTLGHGTTQASRGAWGAWLALCVLLGLRRRARALG